MRVIGQVLRAEGLVSALRRSGERVAEGLRMQSLLARGLLVRDKPAALLNVCGMPVVARLGGLPIQLRARLQQERSWRDVVLVQPGLLQWRSHARRVVSLEDALACTGAHWLHLEGTSGLALESLLRLPVKFILSLHDLDLLLQPAELRAELLARARAVVYPSDFLQSAYGVAGQVIEPGSPATALADPRPGLPVRVAYVGSLKPHKGADLLPELIAATPAAQWHLFGGGDAQLLQSVRTLPGVTMHGYYRVGQLPQLLARHRIGLAVLPSVVQESFGLTLSECWLAGVPAVAFDHGALGQRIRHGGGWVVPAGSGAAGLAKRVLQWLDGALQTRVPKKVATPLDAALAHRALYSRLGVP